jgi:gamma-glutamylputrescine oxidase
MTTSEAVIRGDDDFRGSNFAGALKSAREEPTVLLEKEKGLTENSYYEASVQRPPPAPPLTGKVSVDVCVVGGGYAGLSAALELATHGFSVALLEARTVGWGASGRNGGHVIVGYATDDTMEHQLSPADARRAWDISAEGVRLLRERIDRYAIDCDYRPGYLTLSVNARKSRALQAWAERVQRVYEYPMEWIPPEKIRDWVASERFHAGTYDEQSGHLHPLKFCLGLAEAARVAGVRFFENSPVTQLLRGEQPLVKTATGEVACRFVVLAGNVYLGEFGRTVAPEITGRIMPVGTYIIATESMGPDRAHALLERRAAASDTNFVLDYFRLSADHRLLFGSGDSYSAATPRKLVGKMRRQMLLVFPQLADLKVEYAWGGFVDVTMNRAPDFGRIGGNIYYLQGFSGHGLALTGMAGKLVAEAIAGQAERFDLFARIKHLPFPGGAHMRTPALVLGMLYFRLRDLF